LSFALFLLATACSNRGEIICLPEYMPKEELQISFDVQEYPQEEVQPETHRTSTHVQELPENEMITRIRTTTFENFIFDTIHFYHTVELANVFEPGMYKFTITQEINDANRPFHFHFYGEKGFNEDIFWSEYTHTFTIRITDYDGNFIQQIENIPTLPSMGGHHISFGDFNFDGFLDMTIKRHAGGVRGGAPHYIWIWNEYMNEFIFNAELSEISYGRNLEINTETQQVMAWFSSVTGWNYIFFEFIESTPTAVSTLEWIHFDPFEWAAVHLDIDPPKGYTTVLIRQNLMTGEVDMWYEIWRYVEIRSLFINL